MDDVVWLYTGLLASIIMLGIIGSVLLSHQNESQSQQLFQSITLLRIQADNICKMPQGAQLSVRARIPSGALLYLKRNKICGSINDKLKCEQTDCIMKDEVLLNLSGAETIYKTKEYDCVFHNNDILLINCTG